MDLNISTDVRKAALETWLAGLLAGPPARIAPASADASFRRYFRVWHDGRTYIAMDAPPGREDLGPFIQVAEILAEASVNVPRVLERDADRGFLLLTDLGSRAYLDALREGDRPRQVVRGCHRGAGADPVAGASRCPAPACLRCGPAAAGNGAVPRVVPVPPPRLAPLGGELGVIERAVARLTEAALAQPQVLVHRDYHSRNLMVCDENPGILDFQDAVRGPTTYDLVSLLKDCYISWPRERVLEWLDVYRAAAAGAGLHFGSHRAAFIEAFDLMGLQRHLKVLGIFARLWYRDGKPGYLADLPLVLEYALDATLRSGLMAELGEFLQERVVPEFAGAQHRAQVPA